jgi:hypothetical protein
VSAYAEQWAQLRAWSRIGRLTSLGFVLVPVGLWLVLSHFLMGWIVLLIGVASAACFGY